MYNVTRKRGEPKMARTGRPKSLNPKQHVVTIRLTDVGWERYSDMLALADVSGAELIRMALDCLYKEYEDEVKVFEN